MQAQHLGLQGTALVVGEKLLQADVEHVFELRPANVPHLQAQLRKSGTVGANDPAVARHRDDAFGDTANPFGLRVQMQADVALAGRCDQAVLDHAGRRADQAQRVRVRVAAAVVTGNIQNAQHLARGRHNGRGGAG